MRRTRIIATLGPAVADPDVLRQLLAAGTDAVRLNFSHGTHEDHARSIVRLRAAAAELGRPVAIIADLCGPKLRTGPLAAGPVELRDGEPFTLTARDVPGDARETGLSWPPLARDVRVGDALLLDDGALELRVESTDGTDVRCTVVRGGLLGARKGINLPHTPVSAPALTEKDRADLAFGLAQGIDAVMLSFVRRPEDLQETRALMRAGGADALLYAKIERAEAVARVDALLPHCDGIVVARGDLGVEIPLEGVPPAQKLLIDKALQAGKLCITATQMLKSMVESSRPTRAEVSDVANAVLDGSDGLLLTEETAAGRHPVEAVAMMARVIEAAESIFPHRTWEHRFDPRARTGAAEAVAHAAVRMAAELGAAAIITLTRTGSTTQLVARWRPVQPLLALTPEPAVLRRLGLVWGAQPVLLETEADGDRLQTQALAACARSGLARPGDTVVLTAGWPLAAAGGTNLIRVAQVPAREG
ncbi:MAG: pyruvate kinase [Candidatus Krumholzibacteriia bacterium]